MNKRIETAKYVIFDIASAILAWILFFNYCNNSSSILFENYINLYKRLKLEDEKLQILINWQTQVINLKQQAMPPQPMQAPNQPMTPEPEAPQAPVSPVSGVAV